MSKFVFTLLLFIVLNLFQTLTICAQNIVPNWSFDTITTCSIINAGVYFGQAPPWDSPSGGSPDLFNSCSVTQNFGVPQNNKGFQHPHHGNGYAGGVFFVLGQLNREYIQVQMDSILIPQHKYCVSFYVNLADNFGPAINNIGMYISNTHTNVSTSYRLNFIPQINETNVISDTANWTLISGFYIAGGGEQYIIIGNFYPNAATDSLIVNNAIQSYYFVDDVSIVDCTEVGVGADELSNENSISIFPNPTSGIFTISTVRNKIKQIKVTNLIGQEITTTVNPTVNLTSEPKGIYFVRVQTEKGTSTKKLIKQ